MVDQANGVIALGDLSRFIRRAIIDHNHFVIWVVEFFQRRQTRIDSSLPVVNAHDNRNIGIGAKIWWKRIIVDLFNGVVSRLRLALAIYQSESPVVDLKSLGAGEGMPIIRPGKDNGSRDARFIASLQLPRKSFSLKTGSFPNGIDAGLRQNEGSISSKIM